MIGKLILIQKPIALKFIFIMHDSEVRNYKLHTWNKTHIQHVLRTKNCYQCIIMVPPHSWINIILVTSFCILKNNVIVHKYKKNKYVQMEIKYMTNIVLKLKPKRENHLPCNIYEEFLTQLHIMCWLMAKN